VLSARLPGAPWALGVFLAIATTAPASAGPAPASGPSREYGLAVGQHAPAFTLPGQDGRAVSLETLLKSGPVALVFFRSADWCMYCKLEMVQLQEHLAEIEGSGGRVIGVSCDSLPPLRTFTNRRSITIPLLSDPASRTIDAYDVRSNGKPGEPGGVARHAIFIIDSDGVIRDKSYQVSFAERPAVEELTRALRAARDASDRKRL